jgi:hypothetical protein
MRPPIPEQHKKLAAPKHFGEHSQVLLRNNEPQDQGLRRLHEGRRRGSRGRPQTLHQQEHQLDTPRRCNSSQEGRAPHSTSQRWTTLPPHFLSRLNSSRLKSRPTNLVLGHCGTKPTTQRSPPHGGEHANIHNHTHPHTHMGARPYTRFHAHEKHGLRPAPRQRPSGQPRAKARPHGPPSHDHEYDKASTHLGAT